MRNWITLVEKVVHRADGYIIAIEPTKLEWTTNFRRGAAGVFLKDGRVVVGDGSCLDHDSVVSMASLDQNLRKYTMQLGPTRGFAELWLMDESADEMMNMSEAEKAAAVDKELVKRWGGTRAQIEAEVTPALQRFAPGYVFRAIAFDENAEPLLDGDEAFRDGCWSH